MGKRCEAENSGGAAARRRSQPELRRHFTRHDLTYHFEPSPAGESHALTAPSRRARENSEGAAVLQLESRQSGRAQWNSAPYVLSALTRIRDSVNGAERRNRKANDAARVDSSSDVWLSSQMRTHHDLVRPMKSSLGRWIGLAASVTLLGALGCAKRSDSPSGSPNAENAQPPSQPVAQASGGSAPAASAAPPLLAPGSPAPDIEAVAHNGQTVKLSGFKGRPVVVYFYPKDDTTGCTIEAEGLRDEWSELGKLNAVVLGVSTDDNTSHKAFAEKYSLPFLLLPDTDHQIARAFGVPISNGYAKRVTFVIDAKGQVAKVYPAVNPRGHATELVAALSTLK
jgi:thioredoxin-dependent peroxiredoxin